MRFVSKQSHPQPRFKDEVTKHKTAILVRSATLSTGFGLLDVVIKKAIVLESLY